MGIFVPVEVQHTDVWDAEIAREEALTEPNREFTNGGSYHFRSIKLACKSERVPVDWEGTYASLTRLFTEEFTQHEEPEGTKLLDLDDASGGCVSHAKRAFRLWDPATRLAFENFVLDDVKDGDTIQVNFEMFDVMLLALDTAVRTKKAAAKRRRREASSNALTNSRNLRGPSSGGKNHSADSSPPTALSSARHASASLYAMPSVLGARLINNIGGLRSAAAQRARMASEKRRALFNGGSGRDGASRWSEMSTREKTWLVLDDPASGPLASAIAMLFLVLILFSTTMYCLQTAHGIYSPDFEKSSVWFISEAFCIGCFTVELGVRLWAAPDRRKFAKEGMNVIDLIAIVPFYLDLIAQAASNGNADEIPGVGVIRVLRLARLFKLLRTSKSSVDLFAETMVKSFKALNMLLLLITIGVVLFSSLMYFIERGRWNGVGGYWEQVYSYNCPVTVSSTSRGEPNSFLEITKPLLRGNGALNDTQNVLTYSAGENKPCALQSVSPDATTATFLCEYPYKRSESCVSMYRQSQYDSIARAFWWTFVTMTTVGYGDQLPDSVLGKVFAGFVMCFGVLVLALPVTVIGSNFSNVFHRNLAEEKAWKKKNALIPGADLTRAPSTPRRSSAGCRR